MLRKFDLHGSTEGVHWWCHVNVQCHRFVVRPPVFINQHDNLPDWFFRSVSQGDSDNVVLGVPILYPGRDRGCLGTLAVLSFPVMFFPEDAELILGDTELRVEDPGRKD